MSSQASNYSIQHLLTGIGISTVSTLLTLAVLYLSRMLASADGICFGLLILFYSIMMFASSYVEEEQHFWYWASAAWFFYLFIRRYALPHHPSAYSF